MARQQLGRGNGLNGFAQAHFIANQATARTRGKQGALRLVRVEFGLEQLVQRLVIRALGVSLAEQRVALLGIQLACHKLPDVVITTQVMANFLRGLQQSLQARKTLWAQRPLRADIKQFLRLHPHCIWTIGTQAQPYLALAGVIEPDFAVIWLKTMF